LKSEIYLIL